MFWGWLKGILANVLFWVGLAEIFYGLYLIGDEGSINRFGTSVIIIGIIMSLVGSYLRYVIKKTKRRNKE